MSVKSTLQHRLGNRGTQALASQVVATSSPPGIAPSSGAGPGQRSLSQPGDAQEREAERVADVVMRTTVRGSSISPSSIPTVQRACAHCEEETSMRMRADQPVIAGDATHAHRSAGADRVGHVSSEAAASIHDVKSGGAPLPAATRAFFEPRFAADFSRVRVHTGARADSTAKAINAKAFTVGSNVVFAGGQYSPESHEGRGLLAHELVHVVQQSDSASGPLVRRKPLGAGAKPTADHEDKDPAPALGDYIVALRRDGSWVLTFNTTDMHGWQQPVLTAFRYYMWQVFPGVTDPEIRQLLKEENIGFDPGGDPIPKENDRPYEIHVKPDLQRAVIAWMRRHHPTVTPRIPKIGADGLRHASQGGGGGGEPGKDPSADSRGSTSSGDVIRMSKELFERFRKAFPDEGILHSKAVWPDLLAFMADHADEVKRLRKGRSGHSLDMDTLRKLLEALKRDIEAGKGEVGGDPEGHEDGKSGGAKTGSKDGDIREQREGGESGGSIYGEEGGSPHGWIRWVPAGAIALRPAQPIYVAGASIQVELIWDLSVHPRAGLVLLPNHCEYLWTLRRNNQLVDYEGHSIFANDRSSSLEFGDKPGTYEIGVAATSKHFKTNRHVFWTSVKVNVVSEKQAEKAAFDTAHVAGKDAAFTRDDQGTLHLREGQRALTVKDELETLHLTKGAIDDLGKQGKISPQNQKVLDEQLEKQREALAEIEVKTEGAAPYVVRGTFTSREDSTSMPLRVLMHTLRRSISDGEAHYRLILHDTSLGDPQQHPGKSSHSLEGERMVTVFQLIEREALEDMADHFHAHNDYPKGTVHLAAQRQTADAVWEKTLNTNNARKKFKKVVGTIAMVGGIALLVVPGGNVFSVGLMAVTTTAGLLSIAAEVEDRIGKEGRLKFDRRLVMDVLQVMAMALPFGGLSKTLAKALPVSKGKYLLCMATVDVAQGFVMASQIGDQLQLIEANTAVALNFAPNEEVRRQIRADRDRQVGEVIGGAIVSGGFLLVSLGGNIKQVVATSRAGHAFTVREPVVDIVNQGRERIQETLASDTFAHGNEQVQLNSQERQYLTHELATPAATKEKPGAPDAKTGKPAHEPAPSKAPAQNSGKAGGPEQVTHVVFSGRGDNIAAAAAKVTPEPGYFDVVVHSDSKTFYVLHDGNWVAVKPNSVRKWLARNASYSGAPIRLLACESGALTDGLAQSMANGMGANVKAPTDSLWIHGDGSLSIGADPAKPTGTWHEFTPSTSKSAEPAAPETAPDTRVREGETSSPGERPAAGEKDEDVSLGKKKKTPATGPPPPPQEARRSTLLVERAEALPQATPGRQALIEEAKALDKEEGPAKELPAGEDFEKKLLALEEKLALAELPVTAKGVLSEATTLEEAANKLPPTDATKWDKLAKAQDLKRRAQEIADHVDAGLREPATVVDLKKLREELVALRGEPTSAPTTSRWDQRRQAATWDSHGGKHTKARTDADAKALTTPTDRNSDPAAQYLPNVDVPALERRALNEGEVYKGDPEQPGSTVFVWYDAEATIGYDHGEPVSTMRVEITSGDVFHGHPRKER
jgi:hypothetical protein